MVGVYNYYPFGQLIENRTWEGSSARFGFQGQERDDEIAGKGNSLHYTARDYSTQTARMDRIDPLSDKFPSQSPYVTSGNSPIMMVDVEGKFPVDVHQTILKIAMKNIDIGYWNKKELLVGVALADYIGFNEDWHFDNKADIGAISAEWDKIDAALLATSLRSQTTKVGIILHKVADFYSHSNYVELYMEYYIDSGGDICDLTPKNIPTYSQAMKTGFNKTYYTDRLHTGTFDIKSYITGSEEEDPNSHFNMNKDKGIGSGEEKLYGSKYTLYNFAAGAAISDSKEKLMQQTECAKPQQTEKHPADK